jgi:hypothetical protein
MCRAAWGTPCPSGQDKRGRRVTRASSAKQVVCAQGDPHTARVVRLGMA